MTFDEMKIGDSFWIENKNYQKIEPTSLNGRMVNCREIGTNNYFQFNNSDSPITWKEYVDNGGLDDPRSNVVYGDEEYKEVRAIFDERAAAVKYVKEHPSEYLEIKDMEMNCAD